MSCVFLLFLLHRLKKHVPTVSGSCTKWWKYRSLYELTNPANLKTNGLARELLNAERNVFEAKINISNILFDFIH